LNTRVDEGRKCQVEKAIPLNSSGSMPGERRQRARFMEGKVENHANRCGGSLLVLAINSGGLLVGGFQLATMKGDELSYIVGAGAVCVHG